MSQYWNLHGVIIIPMRSDDDYDLDEYKQLRASGAVVHFVLDWTPLRILQEMMTPSEFTDCGRYSTTEPRDVPKRFVVQYGNTKFLWIHNKLLAVHTILCQECFVFPYKCVLHPLKKQRVTRDVAADTKLIEDKLRTYLASAKKLKLKKGCKLENGQMFMMCVVCEIFRPRTTEYFDASMGGSNFVTSLPGHEYLCNSISRPCKKCWVVLSQKHHATESGFIRHLLWASYPKLTVEWFYDTLQKQNGNGIITNMKLKLTTNSQNSAGIHRKDNSVDHVPENCFLEVQELNVPQYDSIPDLQAAWVEVYSLLVTYFDEDEPLDCFQPFQENLTATPKSLGININPRTYAYNKELRNKYLKYILHCDIRSHILEDVKKQRFKLPPETTMNQFVKLVYPNAIAQLKKQEGRCAYSHIGLTIPNLWTRFSFERLDNNLPHFTNDGKLPNCVFICRLFNGSRQLSRKMILEYFLMQNLVKVPDNIRTKVQQILNSDGNPTRKKRRIVVDDEPLLSTE